MGQEAVSASIGMDQVVYLVQALSRLTGFSAVLEDETGTMIATSSGEATRSSTPILVIPLVLGKETKGRLVLDSPASDPSAPFTAPSVAQIQEAEAQARTVAGLIVNMARRTLDFNREILEKDRIEKALLAREEQYREFVDQMSEGILAADLDSRITFANPRIAELLGYGVTELVGIFYHDLMDPALRAAYQTRIEHRHAGERETYESLLNRKDGGKVCFLISASPLRDTQGAVIGSLAVMSDITARKGMEEVLRTSEEKFRNVFESMQDVYYRSDAAGRITLISPSGARLLGYESIEDLIGCDVAGKMYLHPPDRQLLLAVIREKGFVKDYEVTLRRADGTPVIVSTNSRLMFDEQGVPSGVEGVFFDITERKNAEEALRQSEERYRLIVDNVQDIIFSHLPDGTISFIGGGVRQLGYDPEGGLGKNIFEFVHPDDIPIARDAYLNLVREFKGSQIELRVRHQDGEYSWMEEHSDPIVQEGRLIQVNCVMRNITERKKAEDALRLSEEKYRRIVNHIQDIIYSYQPDGSISFISESVHRLGYQPEEMIGASLFSLIHPEDIPNAYRSFERAVRENFHEHIECRVKRKDGSYVWIEENSEPIFMDGQLVQINAVARDITERKRAELALREGEEKYRMLVEQLSEGILVSDFDGTITFANPRMAEMLGFTVEELVGRKDTGLRNEEEMPRYRERAAARKQGISEQYEIQLIKKNGDIAHFLVSGTPLRNWEGKVVGSFGIYSDITEWKRVEEELKRLSAAIEQASDSIIITDTQGKILYANPASQTLTGMTLAELLETNLDHLRNIQQSEDFYNQLWKTVMKGETWSGHLSNVKSDGTRYETMTTMSPVRDRGGRIQYVVTSSKDITREAELEVQLRHSQRMEAIGVMAGGIAHDFNNILTPVLGYTEMALSRTGLDAKVTEYLSEIASAGQRASELVQQILTFSRHSEQVKHPIQVDSIIKESLKLMRAAIPSTISIRQRIGGVGVQVMADASQLHQVVMNLCTNAFHAMRERGGIMEVSLEATAFENPLVLLGSTLPPGNYLRLKVSDSGRGIDEETQKKIFLPFFTTKRVGEGTGLGLSIVHGIVVGMGGGISVESSVGKGSTFTVYFPTISTAVDEQAVPHPPAMAGTERLLVVDDEAIIGTMLQDALAFIGYQVRTSESAVEALELLGSDPSAFDLVITDLTMPELTGVDLAKKIWNLRSDLPVILMTGYTENLDEESAKEIGFSALLRKPISVSVIGHTVRSILDWKMGSGAPPIA
jgi:PAS domain S-box-containing protein